MDSTTARPAQANLTDDIVVTIVPCLDAWYGTRAQIEAAGIIRPAFEWPAGHDTAKVADGRFLWTIWRAKPPGYKGALRRDVDYWVARRALAINACDGWAASKIEEKRRDYWAAVFNYSPAGRAQGQRLWKAREDEKFMAFMASVLPPKPKRGRSAEVQHG